MLNKGLKMITFIHVFVMQSYLCDPVVFRFPLAYAKAMGFFLYYYSPLFKNRSVDAFPFSDVL